MKTIKSASTNEIIIKNSRFITVLVPVFDDTDINSIFEDIKIKYPKATHYCYAYITKSFKKASDDGEPGGTAGMPMLNVLDKEGMINTLAITIRYFGGIKLGAGGLVRAYSKSVRDAIIESETVEIEEGYSVMIKTSYDEQKDLEYILKNCEITNKEYLTDVTYTVLIPKNKLDILNNYSYQIIKEEYIKKFSD
ncbi:MAG: YigZ family protein [Bacilli bacterium]|nr:YigZ family protein [Bacilli bacterium]